MSDVNDNNFGLVIAYVIPGFFGVLQCSQLSPLLRTWLAVSPADAPTVGGFLYGSLAAIAFGMVASAVRWATLDVLHHATGVHPPTWNFKELQTNVDAFERMVRYHFRYYQFYGNSLVVLVFVCLPPAPLLGWFSLSPLLSIAFALALACVLFAASRDALRKYYARTSAFLPVPRVKGSSK